MAYFWNIGIIFVSDILSNGLGHLKIALQSPNDSSICPIYEPKVPQTYLNDKSKVHNIVHDEKFRLQSVKKLSGAVQVDTQIGDNQPDVPDAPEHGCNFKHSTIIWRRRSLRCISIFKLIRLTLMG